jgi:biopolymer transport protein ExbD/biopolymer transport protein TolR
MRRREPLRANAELNLVNIIDVIFAILVVFMITAPLTTQGVKVELPRAQAGSVDEKETLEITITREREILIGKTASSLQGFEKDFRAAFSGNPETAILINGDRTVPYGIVMEVVAAVNRREDGVIELRPLRRSVAELFKGPLVPKGPALDVDAAIADAVEDNDTRTKTTKRRP